MEDFHVSVEESNERKNEGQTLQEGSKDEENWERRKDRWKNGKKYIL